MLLMYHNYLIFVHISVNLHNDDARAVQVMLSADL
jgi:hypothetical protein